MAALPVPQRLIEPGERGHEDRPATIEASAIADLPDVLDSPWIVADETVPEGLEGAVDRLGMSFETRLAPPEAAIFGLDPDEQPSRRHVKGLDAGDFHGTISKSDIVHIYIIKWRGQG